MRISICDDEEMQLSLIGDYVMQYIENENFDICVKSFREPYDLLEYEKQHGGSEIYLLDIVMDGMSGLELGRHIREYNKRAIIIYLTTSKEFSLDAFSVNAFSYLVKPFEKDCLFGELDKCFEYCLPPQKEERIVTVKTAEGLIPMASDKINAVEYIDHRLIYHTDNGKIESISSREPFDKQAAEIIKLDIFVKCADCYLINMKNILSVTARGFKMKNGSEFPVTRKYSAARDMFLKYKFGGSEIN